jgi:hypothetical protein
MNSVPSNNQGAQPPVFSAAVSELMNRREKEIRELEVDLNELQKIEKQIIRELHERMREQTAVYLRQKEQIASTQRMITKQQARSSKKQAPLKKKIELLKKRNAILQSSLSPIAKAPNEVLSHIFQEYVSMNLSPWLLTRVSMRWRQVAISTPSLWSRIAIQDSPNPRDTVSSMVAARRIRHFLGSRNICFKERELETILRYSGGASLDIIVNGSSENGTLQDNLIANLKRLTKPQVMKRIETLFFEIRKDDHAPTFVPDGFRSAMLPNLRILRISDGMSQQWKDDLLQAVSASAMNLQVLKVHTHLVTLRSFPDEAWSRIRTLELTGLDSSRDLNEFIPKILTIETLNGAPYFWPSFQTPCCILQCVKNIILRAGPRSFRQVQWPSLEELNVTDHNIEWIDDDDSELDLIELPRLTTMYLWNSQCPARWFSQVSMPKLTHLYLETVSMDLMTLNLGGFVAIRTLVLRALVSDHHVISLVDNLPNLESFTSIPLTVDATYALEPFPIRSPYNLTYGLQLVLHLNQCVDGSRPCPRLRELILGCDEDRVHTRKGQLVPFIKSFIRARKLLGYPLEKVEVWWRMGFEPQVYST